MRIALMADIHANRRAFEACLDHARALRVDRLVFLGDYVGYGPEPNEVVERVMMTFFSPTSLCKLAPRLLKVKGVSTITLSP